MMAFMNVGMYVQLVCIIVFAQLAIMKGAKNHFLWSDPWGDQCDRIWPYHITDYFLCLYGSKFYCSFCVSGSYN